MTAWNATAGVFKGIGRCRWPAKMDELPRDVLGIIYKEYLRLRSDKISSGFRSAFQSIVQCMIDGITPEKQYSIYENVAHPVRVLRFDCSKEDATVCGYFIMSYAKCVFLIGTVRYVIRIETTKPNTKNTGRGKPDALYACSVSADSPGDKMYIDMIRDVLSDVLPITHGSTGVYWSGHSSNGVSI